MLVQKAQLLGHISFRPYRVESRRDPRHQRTYWFARASKVVHAFISTRLDYYNHIYFGLTKCKLKSYNNIRTLLLVSSLMRRNMTLLGLPYYNSIGFLYLVESCLSIFLFANLLMTSCPRYSANFRSVGVLKTCWCNRRLQLRAMVTELLLTTPRSLVTHSLFKKKHKTFLLFGVVNIKEIIRK